MITAKITMNSNIIKKCIEELNKQDFRKDYVLGMLESLYESQGNVTHTPIINPITTSTTIPGFKKPAIENNGDLLNAEAAARIKNIDLSAIQTG